MIPQVIAALFDHPLNRRFGRISALKRFAGWQARKRLGIAPERLPFVEGTTLAATTETIGSWYSGLDEPEMAFALHYLRPESLFLDVGANAGSYTILAAAVGCRAVAVEPVAASYAMLLGNVAENGAGERVDAYRLGVSDAEGVLSFTNAAGSCNHVAGPGETGETANVVTLDWLCRPRIPDLVKIDVEGHELPILEGGEAAVAAIGALIVETGGTRSDGAAVMRWMQERGFTPCAYDPLARRVLPANGGPNTIFLRDPAAAESVCQAAPSYRLVNGTV